METCSLNRHPTVVSTVRGVRTARGSSGGADEMSLQSKRAPPALPTEAEGAGRGEQQHHLLSIDVEANAISPKAGAWDVRDSGWRVAAEPEASSPAWRCAPPARSRAAAGG
jgi:hypothetical protein